ncbi:integrase [Aureimonas sp. Leaf454]|uniref:integrase n=1 Tax=Aureimonas sp. Leaf454 TaxID=1736381 RepID=UPI0012E37601|nr:integrase [Aureimonas sp. Leaf454]
MGALYDASRSANVDGDKSRKAAEEVADFQKQISEIRTDLADLKWMSGLLLAGVVTLVIRAFTT